MHTLLLKTDGSGRADSLARAAELLRAGRLVAIPTETVYGLGADATSDAAVAAVYVAKGRPSHNPLIVHVHNEEAARRWAIEWPDSAARLAEAFWPGPLTIVVPAAAGLSRLALAGGDTVGLRVPAHPLTLELLRLTGLPIAAPSANRSNALSPTSAEDVLASLGGRIDAVLDGGPCAVGIESAVVEPRDGEVLLHRPGILTMEQLAEAADCPVRQAEQAAGLKSPGMLERHYAPRIPLRLVDEPSRSEGVFLIRFGAVDGVTSGEAVLPTDPARAAALLYQVLRIAESSGAASIEMMRPPGGAAWHAIHDRLRRAATPEPR